MIGGPDFHGIGLNEVVALTENWKDYEYQFRAKDLALGNMIQFLLGQQTGTVWIADFTVSKGGK
jgi:hypothetical protein